MHKSIIRPVRTYGIQLWGSIKPSNAKKLQLFQSICFRLVTSSPWYFTNNNLHKDLKISTLDQLIKLYYFKLHIKLNSHSNLLIK